jgi:hypothetical protein
VADDGWQSRNFDEITQKLSGVKAAVAYDLSSRWKTMGLDIAEACSAIHEARTRLNDDRFWSGERSSAAQAFLDSYYKTVNDPDSGLPTLAEKISQTLSVDGDVLSQASQVPQNHSRPNSKATLEEWNKATEELRADAQRLYTSPLDVQRPKVAEFGKQDPEPLPNGPSGNGDNGSGSAGTGGAVGEKLQSPSGDDGLANKDTRPQLASGEGQQPGAGQSQGQGFGQGQGSGQGGGSGGGAPGGGSGSGSGLGSGFGSGAKDSGAGMPVGSTTAAGYSPSATGAGSGSGSGMPGGGPGSLRGGAGVPGGVSSGTGSAGAHSAAMGAAGVRGVPMGMLGGAGAHGAHGKNQDDTDKPIPSFLINVDNGNELFGEPIKASPGVIGDWSENEQAEKQAREAEKRRYKSLGWNVKFSDEEA